MWYLPSRLLGLYITNNNGHIKRERNRLNKKRAISLGNLVFLIPVILLSVFMWNDYKRYIDEYQPSFERIYMLDEGKKLIGLAKHPVGEQYDVYLFDPDKENLITDTTIHTNLPGWGRRLISKMESSSRPTTIHTGCKSITSIQLARLKSWLRERCTFHPHGVQMFTPGVADSL